MVTVIRAIVGLAKRDKKVKLDLAEGIALALQFKMGGELLRTVIVREWSELLILGAVVLLRAVMAILIHFEIRAEKQLLGDLPVEPKDKTKKPPIVRL